MLQAGPGDGGGDQALALAGFDTPRAQPVGNILADAGMEQVGLLMDVDDLAP